ncbi:MAG: 23S rRNA (adenine(1618)-N(6))-methyltransferase RlmF [Gillisia sp.]
MHPNNVHNQEYDMEALTGSFPELSNYIFQNDFGKTTIDFSNPEAVLHLNKALLKHHYQIANWNIPKDYLCAPIPGRADYIHYLADFLTGEGVDPKSIKGLDIGVGANCIYPILGARIYNWNMTGSDISLNSVNAAKANVTANPGLTNFIEIKHQQDPGKIFTGIVVPGAYFDFSMCNPPFHASAEEAKKGSLKKLKNLGITGAALNFGGQANELWCNGGEALFIKRMIRESLVFKTQIGWFTCLVSKKENLPKIYKQLIKLKAVHKTIEMAHGNKKSRIIAWKFS